MTEADNKKESLRKEIGRFKVFRRFIKKSRQELANELQVSQTIIADIAALGTGNYFFLLLPPAARG